MTPELDQLLTRLRHDTAMLIMELDALKNDFKKQRAPAPPPPPAKTRGEEVAEEMVEIVRDGGYSSMRFRGQSSFLWHSSDAALMERRRDEMVRSIAAAIDAERRALMP